MPVKSEAGRRYVEAEVDVPGTPEEVWDAIATGPGVSSWFVPTEVVNGPDGKPEKVVSHFSPGGEMDDVAKVTDWQPPHRFTANADSLGPGAPSVATEWIVEAKDGNTCTVRVVHSLFTDKSDWDDQLQMWEYGWPDFFKILRLRLTHFMGQQSATTQLMCIARQDKAAAWAEIGRSLGIGGAQPGERRASLPDAPPLAGTIESVGQDAHPETAIIRTMTPAPGLVHLFVMDMGQTYVIARLYLYGPEAGATIATAQPVWENWLKERFAPVG